jgi:hypothetical protein
MAGPKNRSAAEQTVSASWTDRRVDNAKKRLLKWISRLMQKNGLDATDLEALFAGVARQEDDGKRVPLTTLHRPKKTN